MNTFEKVEFIEKTIKPMVDEHPISRVVRNIRMGFDNQNNLNIKISEKNILIPMYDTNYAYEECIFQLNTVYKDIELMIIKLSEYDFDEETYLKVRRDIRLDMLMKLINK